MQHAKGNKSLKRTENEKRKFNTPPLKVATSIEQTLQEVYFRCSEISRIQKISIHKNITL